MYWVSEGSGERPGVRGKCFSQLPLYSLNIESYEYITYRKKLNNWVREREKKENK